jgi:hypothetical protein
MKCNQLVRQTRHIFSFGTFNRKHQFQSRSRVTARGSSPPSIQDFTCKLSSFLLCPNENYLFSKNPHNDPKVKPCFVDFIIVDISRYGRSLIKSVAFSVTALFTLVAICFFVAAFWAVSITKRSVRTDQPLRHTIENW